MRSPGYTRKPADKREHILLAEAMTDATEACIFSEAAPVADGAAAAGSSFKVKSGTEMSEIWGASMIVEATISASEGDTTASILETSSPI